MKTIKTPKRRSGLFTILMILALALTGVKMNAQCTAMFTAADSAGSTYFTNLSTGSGLTSTWDFGDGTTFSTTGNAVYTYSTPGTYLVCLTVTNALGTCTTSYCDSVSVPYGGTGMCMGVVNSAFVAGDSACYGYFYNTPSASSGQVYHWDYGDGTTSSVVGTNTHLYPANGTYYVCLTVYDGTDSCQYCNYVTINSCSTTACSASFFSVDSSGYVYFSNQSVGLGSGVTCSWSFGDGTVGTSSGDIVHNYTTSRVYYVCMTMSNFLGTCNDTYCDSIYVNTNPGGGGGMCMGVVNPYFTANDSSMYGVFSNTPSGSGQVYFWDFGDGTNSNTIGSVSHLYASPGTYTVCLTVYETGGSLDSCQYCSYVTIGSGGPTPCDASFTIIQDSTNLFNYFVYMNNTSTSSTMSYFWDFGDGTSSTLQYPTHTYPSSGPYYICLTITDSTPMLGCTNTYCDSIAAGHSSTPITLNVVSPTGIQESYNTISSLENYPNPFGESTTINYTLSKDGNVELSIMDLLGKKITSIDSGSKTAGKHTVLYNSNEISGGLYLLQLKMDNNISTKKIIINK